MLTQPVFATKTYSIFDHSVCIYAFGVATHSGNVQNWTLRDYGKREDRGDKELLRTKLALAAFSRQAPHIFAPIPTKCNTLVVKQDHFIEPFSIAGGKTLWRGVEADGVILRNNASAFAMSSADCATIVVMYQNAKKEVDVICSHAGRNSLVDMQRLKTGTPSRKNESVVDSIAEHVPNKNRKSTYVWIGLAIAPGPHYEHRRDALRYPENNTMIDYLVDTYGRSCLADDGYGGNLGWINIKQIIFNQLRNIGFDSEKIQTDGVNTYGDTNPDESPVWHSECRTPKSGVRNLVVVTRNV